MKKKKPIATLDNMDRVMRLSLNRCPICTKVGVIRENPGITSMVYTCPKCHCISPHDRITELSQIEYSEFVEMRASRTDYISFDLASRENLIKIIENGFIEYDLSHIPEDLWGDVPVAPFKVEFNDVHKNIIRTYFSSFVIRDFKKVNSKSASDFGF